jgi:hypothetical protein
MISFSEYWRIFNENKKNKKGNYEFLKSFLYTVYTYIISMNNFILVVRHKKL